VTLRIHLELTTELCGGLAEPLILHGDVQAEVTIADETSLSPIGPEFEF
jgi:hypothetical protein